MDIALATLFFMLAATAPSAAPISDPVRVISLDEALRRAQANQPSLRQAEAQARAADFRTAQARSGYLPQVSANLRYQRNGRSRFGTLSQSNQVVIPSDSPNNYSASLSVDQLLFDFGKTPQRIRSAGASARAQAETAKGAQVNQVYSTRIAYFQAQGNKSLRDSARRVLANQKRHAELIEAQVEAGIRAPIDLLQSRADTAASALQLINAENNYEVAKEELKVAMGYSEPVSFEVGADQLEPVEGEEGGGDPLMAAAVAQRHDMRAAEEQIRSRELTTSSLRREYWPSLIGSAALLESGSAPSELDGSWSAGLSLNWPLFEGGLTRARVGEARENALSAEADRDQIRLQMRSEIEQALLDIRAAKAGEAAAVESLTNTNERLRLAEERYLSGLGNIIELSDAQLKDADAEVQRIQAQFSLAIARATLLRALGRR